jgi:hypothetical protein
VLTLDAPLCCLSCGLHSCCSCLVRVAIAEEARKKCAAAIDAADVAMLSVVLEQQKAILNVVMAIPGSAQPEGVSPVKAPKKL